MIRANGERGFRLSSDAAAAAAASAKSLRPAEGVPRSSMTTLETGWVPPLTAVAGGPEEMSIAGVWAASALIHNVHRTASAINTPKVQLYLHQTTSSGPAAIGTIPSPIGHITYYSERMLIDLCSRRAGYLSCAA